MSNGFYEVPECLAALKKRYQERGLMLTSTKQKSIEREGVILGRWWLIHVHVSLESFGWDVMTHRGHVLTQWLSIGREHVLVPNKDVMLSSSYGFLGPIAVMVATLKKKKKKAA